MALAIVPAVAKIAELRLSIRAPTDEARRGLNMKAPYAPAAREMWAGQILWAALSRDDTNELAAFFESLDGRVTPFGVELAAGFAGQIVPGFSGAASGTLASIPALGADSIAVSVSGSPILAPGTLVGIGDTAGVYQLVEIVAGGAANGSTALKIAPRVRFTVGSTACVLGTVTGKFNLAGDTLTALQFSPSAGTLAVDVMEAL